MQLGAFLKIHLFDLIVCRCISTVHLVATKNLLQLLEVRKFENAVQLVLCQINGGYLPFAVRGDAIPFG